MNIKKDINKLLKENRDKNLPLKELKCQQRAIESYYLKNKRNFFKNQSDILKRYKQLYKRTNSNPANINSIVLSVLSGIVASCIYAVTLGSKSEPGIITIIINAIFKAFESIFYHCDTTIFQKIYVLLIVFLTLICAVTVALLISLLLVNTLIQIFKINKFEDLLIEYELNIIKKIIFK